jgi:hypothetical protein
MLEDMATPRTGVGNFFVGQFSGVFASGDGIFFFKKSDDKP